MRYWLVFAQGRRRTSEKVMAENQMIDPAQPLDQQVHSPAQKEDMIECVMALEAALLPCLPARELQAIDRSPHPSHQIDVERHARDFMEAAKKLQLYFIGLQQEKSPSKAETLRKEISMLEEELNTKTELINKQEKLIQGWRKDLKDQLNKHITELERV
ncbi:Mediator of rna polymerase ii transcription subunit [Thalictrum thalictroides]|uniref:Mediator of rna polymerase ii transcription subunit n=1 Tax=Thalictrum thalictroides TaxID=46969 RepID=A0A7J6VR78_THATH|nr:Mediator of rna polymerase ii transcription subunit [Thalictrum thalictroides]